MRIEGWKGKQAFDGLMEAALVGLNAVMDDHVSDATRRCPTKKRVAVGTEYRKDGYMERDVVFTPKRGRGKGKEVNFIADTWMGRVAGTLKSTVRKVEKWDRAGNLRCYAGNNKVFYARFVEYGTVKAKARPFLRPSFMAIKGTVKERIEAEMRKVPVV